MENFRSDIEKVVEGKESTFMEKLSLEQLKGKRVAKVLSEYPSDNENEKNIATQSAEKVQEQLTWIDDILSKKESGKFSSSDLYVLRNCYAKIREEVAVKTDDTAENGLARKKIMQTLLDKGAFLPSFEQVIFSLSSREWKKAEGPLKIENLSEGDVLKIALGASNRALAGKLLLEDLLPIEVTSIRFNGKEYIRKDGKFICTIEKDESGAVYTKEGDEITILKIRNDVSTAEKAQEQTHRTNQMTNTRVQETQKEVVDAIKSGKNPASLSLNEKDVAFFFAAFNNLFKTLFGDFGGILDALKSAFSGGKLDMRKTGLGGKFREVLSGNKISLASISSPGIEYSESGTTLCSWTVVRSAQEIFGKDLPMGNAYDVRDQYANGSLSGAEKYISGSDAFSKYEGESNLFDVFTTSSSSYGHRVCGFRQGQQIYILDPYTTKTNNPLTLDEYRARSGREVVGVAFHKVDKTVVA